ncbi:YnhF family membrane protein [Vibrio maerlii]|nr:YnhF family membrane protein [Vibrio maerlii]
MDANLRFSLVTTATIFTILIAFGIMAIAA